jgi:2-haloacid dehalogenase
MPTRQPAPTSLIFDFGGVLIDWNPRYLYRKIIPGGPAAVEAFLAEIRFDQWNAEQDRGRPLGMAISALSGQFPQYADWIRAYWERWDETIGGPLAGSVSLLARLRANGRDLNGLSNWPLETFRRVRPKYEFFDWFRTILVSGEVGVAKPDPEIFQLCLARVARPPEDCLFIDDNPANIAVAETLGLQALRFESPDLLERELLSRGILL